MIFESKHGIIMGVANDKSMAAAIAKKIHAEGGRLGFSHLPDTDDRRRMAKRVESVAQDLNPMLIHPCDVTDPSSVESFFSEVGKSMPKIDFLVHSIAFAPVDDIRCQTIDASKDGFLKAMEISVYSLIEVARAAKPYMQDGGAICTMTYLGGERVMPGYNMMGICKSALDTTVKYLAAELGTANIRVNALSAGPMRTLAASAIGDFKQTLEQYRMQSPIKRNITPEDLGNAACFLLSDLGSATTGEILHVDCGYNIMGAPPKTD